MAQIRLAASLPSVTVAGAAAAQANTGITSFTVVDTAAHVLAGLAALSADTHLASIALSDTAPLVVNATQFASYKSTLDKLAAGFAFSASGLSVAQAALAQADTHLAGFTVSDTNAHVLAALAALAQDSHLTALSLTDNHSLAVSYDQFTAWRTTLDKLAAGNSVALAGLSMAQEAIAGADAHVGSIGVSDTAAHVLAGLATLAAETALTSITLTDTTVLTVGADVFGTYKAVLDRMVAADHFVATGLSVAQAASAQADSHNLSFTVSDTAAHVQSALSALNADTHLTSVTLSDGQPLMMTAAQFSADAALVGKLAAGVVTVTGVTAANAAGVGGNAHVGHFGVADTLANIGSNLDALEALAKAGKLTGIAVSDSGHTLTVSASQYAADHDALALLSGNYSIVQGSPAGGFHINLVYDSSMANAPAGFKAGLAAAVSYFQGLFSSNETVTLQVGYGEVGGTAIGGGILGEAGPSRGAYVTYDQYKAAFASHATSADQLSVLANMGADPTHGGTIYVASAEAKALGLMSASDTGVDGVMGFAADATGRLFDYDRTDGVSAGHYDFLGVVEHELTHALGRFAWLDTAQGYFSTLDLTRYSANGVHQFNGAATGYFSVDGGRTNLDTYSTSSDTGDWASSAGNDANNAYANPGVVNAFTHTDVVQMNALGYALA
jgi:hypothetical protein